MLSVAIDDIGTGTQLSEGWSYFLLEDRLVEPFSNEAHAILRTTSMRSFHGKDYKRRFQAAYLNFLQLCKKYMFESNISLIEVVLQNGAWKNKYKIFCTNIVSAVYSNNNVTDRQMVNSAVYLSAPLFHLQFRLKDLDENLPLSIVVDAHHKVDSFNKQTVQIRGVSFGANKLLSMLYNAYRKQQFPKSPPLKNDQVTITNDESNFLLQGADIVGNFSLSYIQKKLGYSSQTVNEKAAIFDEVFGEYFNEIDFNESAELLNANEIKLKIDGQLPMTLGKLD